MKHAFGWLLVSLSIAPASADLIGLRWAYQPNDPVYWNDEGIVEIYLQKVEVEGYSSTVSGVAFSFGGQSIYARPGLLLSEYATSIPGWDTFGLQGFGTYYTPPRYEAWSTTGSAGYLTGPGEFVLGTFAVSHVGPVDAMPTPFTAMLPQDYLGVMGENTLKIAWNGNLAATSYNYVAFAPNGFGNPGWGTRPERGHQPTPRPLFLLTTSIPEPGVMVPLATGYLALARRRCLTAPSGKGTILPA